MTQNKALDPVIDQALDRYRVGWEEEKYVAAIAQAIELCAMFQRPWPEWLNQAALAIILGKQTEADREP